MDWKRIFESSGWYTRLAPLLESKYMMELKNFVDDEFDKGVVYPGKPDIFKAFQACHYDNLKIVILGQDPYHNGRATGLAFANPDDGKLSPSLRIILKNINETVYKGKPIWKNDPTLEEWARQGILLLNTALTVREGDPFSHVAEWDQFIRQVLISISEFNPGLIYMLWGKNAQTYEKYIIDRKSSGFSNTILKTEHPAASIYSGKPWKCLHFDTVNILLEDEDHITW